jgi:hypothetical protein
LPRDYFTLPFFIPSAIDEREISLGRTIIEIIIARMKEKQGEGRKKQTAS